MCKIGHSFADFYPVEIQEQLQKRIPVQRRTQISCNNNYYYFSFLLIEELGFIRFRISYDRPEVFSLLKG